MDTDAFVSQQGIADAKECCFHCFNVINTAVAR
jgi:hypothetical protein